MTNLRKLTRFTALASGVALIAGAVAPILGSGDAAALRIDGITVQGNLLRVAVSSTTDGSASGTLFARMLLGTGEMETMSEVFVPAGQKVFVDFVAPSPIVEVIQVGVVLDDGSPF